MLKRVLPNLILKSGKSDLIFASQKKKGVEQESALHWYMNGCIKVEIHTATPRSRTALS